MKRAKSMRLTDPQKRALRHLAKFPDQWRGDTPVRQRCLNVLKEKGLVKVAFEPDEGWSEMITPAGLEEIANVGGSDEKPFRNNLKLREGRIMRQIILTLEGEQPISWNKMYSGSLHWNERREEAARVHLAVRVALDPDWVMFDKLVEIEMRVYFANRRLQLDWANIPAKIYEDGLIGWLIKNDSPKYVRGGRVLSLLDRQNPRVEIEIREVEDD